ncbi:hypothetical protein [Streptomyces chartreusis]
MTPSADTATPAWEAGPLLAAAVPDVHFSAAQLRAARHVVQQQLGGTQAVELAFLGGSLSVGLGHGTSDVDLYVVGKGLPRLEVVHEQNGVAVHMCPLTADQVRGLITLGSRYQATGADRSQLAVDLKTLHGLVRLLTGRRIVASPSWQQELGLLNEQTVRRILMARHANLFAASAEDAFGALESGDLFTAATVSGLALESAAEAVLAASGDVYVGPKFLFRRLARTSATRPWCSYLWRLANAAFHTEAPLHAHAVRTVVEERLLAGNLLLSWACVEGWHQPLTTLPPPAGPPVGRRGPRRSPYHAPVRFTDGWALMGPDQGCEVSEPMVRLWRRLDGRDMGTLLAGLRHQEPRLAAVDPADIYSSLHTLGKLGTVESQEALPVLAALPPASGSGLFADRAPRFSCHPVAALPIPKASR